MGVGGGQGLGWQLRAELGCAAVPAQGVTRADKGLGAPAWLCQQ